MNPQNRENGNRRDYNNGKPSSSREPIISLSKSSGKENGYMLWVKERGRKQFYQRFGYSFKLRDHDDMAQMGSLWNVLTDEQKKEYKERAKRMNQDMSVVYNKRQTENSKKRELRHKYAMTHYHQKIEHETEVRRRQENIRKERGHILLPSKNAETCSVPVLEDDIKIKRAKDREHLKQIITFQSMDVLNNPLIVKDSNIIQIISVFPITFVYKTKSEILYTYPAEIAIITCHLRTGFIRKSSIQVYFDQNSFYGKNANESNVDFVKDLPTRETYGRCLGVPADGPVNGVPPHEAFGWLLDNIDSRAFLLCDVNQYTWVTRGLETIAIISGFNDRTLYQNEISKRFMTIQDFAVSLLANMPCGVRINEKWTEDRINDAFMNNYLAFEDRDNFYCDFHVDLPSSMISCKYQCPLAHCARLCHVLFEVFNYNRLRDFTQCYDNNHKFCTLDRDPIATLPMAPNIEKAPGESSNNQGNLDDSSKPSIFQNLRPILFSSDREDDMQFCRNMFFHYSDSDSNDDDDTMLYNQCAGNNPTQVASNFSGLPRVDFFSNSNRNSLIYSTGDGDRREQALPHIREEMEDIQVVPIERELRNKIKDDNGCYLYRPCDTRELKLEYTLNEKDSEYVEEQPIARVFIEANRRDHHPAVKNKH